MISRPSASGSPISFPDFSDWKDADLGFDDLAGFTEETYTYLGTEQAESWNGAEVTTNLFPLLGVKPSLGRWLDPTADGFESTPTVLLIHRIWTRVFGADSGILGQVVSLGETSGRRQRLLSLRTAVADCPL